MIAKMTRKEFWERHEAIKQVNADGVAIAPANPAYDKDAHTALHREYYGQWAQHVRPLPKDLLKRCKEALDAGDVHMNSPYTSLKDWDGLQHLTKGVYAEDNGTWKGWSLAFNVCVLKEAARLQLERVNA